MDIYDRLDLILKDKSMSRRELAKQAGIPPTTLQSALARKRSLTMEQLNKIASALNVSPTYLLMGHDGDMAAPIMPDEFNAFSLTLAKIGYRVTLDEGQYYITGTSRDTEGLRVPITVEQLKNLVRASENTVKALVESFIGGRKG